MKRLLAIIGVSVLSFSLMGCQFFQPQQTPPSDEAVTETSTATVTIEEGEENTATSTGTLEIVEGEEDTSSSTGTLEIEE